MTSSSKLHWLWVVVLGFCFSTSPVYAAVPSLTFSPSMINTSGDSEIVATIVLNTGGVGVSGAGAKLIFDPYYLTAARIEPSSMFTDYPAEIIDNEHGTITISGITSSPTDTYQGVGNFADVVFRPFHAGTSKVTFVFSPGSTTDSNIAVMTGNGDILSQVNELMVDTTLAGSDSTVETPTPTPAGLALSPELLTQNSVVKQVASTLGITKVADQYAAARPGRSAIAETSADPMAPITRQNPITDPSTLQPAAPVHPAQSATPNYLLPLLLAIILILVGVIIWFVLRRRANDQRPPLPPTPMTPPINPGLVSPS